MRPNLISKDLKKISYIAPFMEETDIRVEHGFAMSDSVDYSDEGFPGSDIDNDNWTDYGDL